VRLLPLVLPLVVQPLVLPLVVQPLAVLALTAAAALPPRSWCCRASDTRCRTCKT
jgi:hypothetical protein